MNQPLVNAEEVSDVTGLSFPSAYKLIGDMEWIGILKEITEDEEVGNTSLKNTLKYFNSKTVPCC